MSELLSSRLSARSTTAATWRRFPQRVRVPAGVVGCLAMSSLTACSPGAGDVRPVLELTLCQAAFSEMSGARAGDADLSYATAAERALDACSSHEEWLSAASESPGALPAGSDPAELLDEWCAQAERSDVAACSGS